MRIFVAGASGVIGIRLIPLLVAGGHAVAGMTRSPAKVSSLREVGAQAILCDVFDAEALTQAVTAFRPDVVFHQLTDLPDSAADLARLTDRNDRMRSLGTRNLMAAASAAKAERVIAQSISWELRGQNRQAAMAEHERMVLQGRGAVIRYGQFYGPGTYYENEPLTRRAFTSMMPHARRCLCSRSRPA